VKRYLASQHKKQAGKVSPLLKLGQAYIPDKILCDLCFFKCLNLKGKILNMQST
jgi:hypothetical protein